MDSSAARQPRAYSQCKHFEVRRTVSVPWGPSQQLLHALRHLPLPDPLSSQGALPVPLEVVLGGKLLAFGVFEWCAAYEDFKERDSE